MKHVVLNADKIKSIKEECANLSINGRIEVIHKLYEYIFTQNELVDVFGLDEYMGNYNKMMSAQKCDFYIGITVKVNPDTEFTLYCHGYKCDLSMTLWSTANKVSTKIVEVVIINGGEKAQETYSSFFKVMTGIYTNNRFKDFEDTKLRIQREHKLKAEKLIAEQEANTISNVEAMLKGSTESDTLVLQPTSLVVVEDNPQHIEEEKSLFNNIKNWINKWA